MLNTRTIFGFLLVALLFVAGCSSESKKETLANDTSLVVINVLDKEMFDDAHLKGSINIPFEQVLDSTKGWQKSRPLVIYCSNFMCGASAMAVQQLQKEGFTNVRAYEGGTAQWYQLKFPITGPAQKKYLQQVMEQPETHSTTVPTIDAQTLKKEMEEAKLL